MLGACEVKKGRDRVGRPRLKLVLIGLILYRIGKDGHLAYHSSTASGVKDSSYYVLRGRELQCLVSGMGDPYLNLEAR